MEDSFVAVADVQDVAPGNLKRVELDGHGYLIANVDGDFYAVDDLCSHEDFRLSYGCLEGDKVKCSLHGSRFCLKTGIPQEEPADQPIATYPITILDGRIWINPGSAK